MSLCNYDIKKINKHKIVIFFLLTLFLLEFLTTMYLHFWEASRLRLVGGAKAVFLVFLIVSVKFNKSDIYYYLIILLSIFLLNQLVLKPSFYNEVQWHIFYGSFYYLIRYLYIFIFVAFYLSIENSDKLGKRIIKLFRNVLVFNSFFILIGVLFNLDLFTSYPWSSMRFGSDGFFNKVNETSHLYTILIANLYYDVIMNKTKPWLLFYIVFVSMLLGTKTVLLFLSLLLIFHLIYVSKNRKNYMFLLSILALFVISFFEKIINYLISISPFWNMLNEKYSVITLLFSKRDLLYLQVLEYFKTSWSEVNYLFGGPFYNSEFVFSQIDIVDVFTYFGGIGTVVYFTFLYKNFFVNINKIALIVFLLVFICGLLSGALFLSFLVMVYLYLSLQDKRRKVC